MFIRKWHTMRLVMMMLALLGVMALPASSEVVSGGPQVGQWRTWVLAAGTEIQAPAPPAETSDQTIAELAE
jgi:type IV secretory pathway TrbL component